MKKGNKLEDNRAKQAGKKVSWGRLFMVLLQVAELWRCTDITQPFVVSVASQAG